MLRILISALVLLSPLPALGQASSLAVGTRVRIESLVGYELRKTTGTITRVTSDSLVLATSVTAERPFAVSSLRSVQISRGRSRAQGALRGFLIGATVVVVPAVLAMASTGETEGAAFGVILALPMFGGVGALLGAAIGREHWETVSQ